MQIVRPADILLPASAEPEKWSVIACDQFTSDRQYWEETCRIVGNSPSTLHMILPEAWIGTERADAAPMRITEKMHQYLKEGVFRELPSAMIAVERTMQDGTVRKGIVAAVDLEAYDYRPESEAPIKATERTVEERLLKRLEMRENAVLELPHTLVFYDDPEHTVTAELDAIRNKSEKQYGFQLMQNGGAISGASLQGEAAERLENAFQRLADRKETVFAAGDGNHSLATAKLCWERMKPDLSEREKREHPARFALVELVNLYDEGVRIESIHRLLRGTDNRDFLHFAKEYFRDTGEAGGIKTIIAGIGKKQAEIAIRGMSAGEIVKAADEMIGRYLSKHGGTEDYIHDASSAVELGSEKNNAYLLLPAVEREEIFSVIRNGMIFPQKSFSIGNARDKRYYLECRRIR